MSKKKILIGLGVFAVLLIGTVAAIAMSDKNGPTVEESWRYRLSVEVETPEGVKSGDAVREVTIQIYDKPINPKRSQVSKTLYKGEAVTVDLGERGTLFAILGTDPEYEFYKAFRGNKSGSTTMEGIEDFNEVPIGKKVVLDPDTFDPFPRLVTFTDINDPKSVKAVNKKDLAATFGKGVNLKKVVIQRTKDRVTRKIGAHLNWLAENYDKRLDGNRFGTIKTDNRYANSLSSGAFSTEENIGGGYLHERETSRGAPLGLHGGYFKIGDKNE